MKVVCIVDQLSWNTADDQNKTLLQAINISLNWLKANPDISILYLNMFICNACVKTIK